MSPTKASACLELATEGEQLCRAGEWEKAISCFKSALLNGTDDVRLLSAIYCQLGNAFIYQHNYNEAVEFYQWYLTLSRRIKDSPGEVQACGNLGITLKLLGKYDEAVLCFTRQLDLARSCLEDQRLEVRALYNLANAFHIKGKWLSGSTTAAASIGAADPSEFPREAKEAQGKAVEFYTKALSLSQILGDRSFEGRLYGHLGNSHYLLGNFHEAVGYHNLRLKFANEFGDVAAQRRAYSNMGNACIFLGDVSRAADHYRNALRLAQQMNSASLEAQSCYSLGNTHTIVQEHDRAVVYHLRHLVISRRLQDRLGEGRAHWSLANLYVALGRLDLALRCARRHRLIARQLHDSAGQVTAKLTLKVIHHLMSKKEAIAGSSGSPLSNGDASPDVHPSLAEDTPTTGSNEELIPTDPGGGDPSEDKDDDTDPRLDEELETELANSSEGILDSVEVVTLTEHGCTTTTRIGCLDISPGGSRCQRTGPGQVSTGFGASHSSTRPIGGGGEFVSSNAARFDYHHQLVNTSAAVNTNTDNDEEQEQLFDEQSDDPQEFFLTLLLDFQSRRMDEQRCLLHSYSTSQLVASDIANNNNNSTEPQMDDARGWELPTSSAGNQVEATATAAAAQEAEEEEAFFDLIAGFQGDRMNDQRACLPAFPGLRLHDAEVNRRSFTTGTLSSVGSGASDGLPEGRLGPLSVDSGRSRRRSCGAGVGDVSPLPQTRQHPHRQGQPATSSNDDLLEMILRLQTRTRINDQRSSLPDPLCRSLASPPHRRRTRPSCTDITTNGEQTRPAYRHRPASTVVPSLASHTVPDEDFFALIQRIQSARLDEQRCNPPEPSSSTAGEPGNAQGMPNSAGPSSNSSSTTVASGANVSNRKPSSSTSGRRRPSWRRFNPSSFSSSGTGGQSK